MTLASAITLVAALSLATAFAQGEEPEAVPGATPETAPAPVDVVLLRNGDRLSGSIVKMDGKKLFITTPYAKEVPVDWKEVASIESAGPHWVRLTTDEFVKGRLTSSPDGVGIVTEDLEAPQPVPFDRVATIGIPPGAKYSGSLGALVSGSTGNTETFILGAAGVVQRDTDIDRSRLGFRTEYEERDNELSVQRARGYGDYDFYLGEKWYLTGLLRLEHDKFEDVRLRTTVGGGPGYRFFDREDLKFRVYAGLAYVNEDLDEAEDRDYLSALAGDEFRWKITESLSFYQLAEVYPSLDDVSDVLIHVEAGIRQSLMKGMFVEFGVVDDYDTEPAPDTKKNDFRYLGQVGYEF
jgi:putative salt-induced outer membrane protein YdiY